MVRTFAFHLSLALVAGLWLSGLSGCSGVEIRKPVPAEAPPWCSFQSGAENNRERGRLVRGVGFIAGVKSHELALYQSHSQARKQITELFDRYAEALLAKFREERAAAGEPISAEGFTELARLVAKAGYRGAPIEDHYVDPKSGTYYALAVIPYEKFVKQVTGNLDLPEPFRAFAEKTSDDLFTALPAFQVAAEK